MKKILKFQFRDLSYGYLVYALVMFVITCIPVLLSFVSEDVNITMSGNGFSSIIFCFVLGIAMYKEHFWMAVQNSISRKLFFWSSLCVMAAISFLCMLLDVLLQNINQSAGMGVYYTLGIWNMCYQGFFENGNAIVTAIVGNLLSFLVFLNLFVMGFLIAGIYCRIPKKYRIIYCVALPVLNFGILPVFLIAGEFVPGSPKSIAEIILHMMGISSGNPLLGMLTMTVVFLIIAFVSYRILRRTDVN